MRRFSLASLLAMAAVLSGLGATPASAQGVLVLDANCPGPPNDILGIASDQRFAQTFTPQRTGDLVRGELEIRKLEAGADWMMQIVATDGAGKPTDTELASTTIADAAVPLGESRLAAVFSPPASVVAGQQYGLLITRPGSAFNIRDRSGNPCPGQEWTSTSGGPWSTQGNPYDLVFAVYFEAAPPPTAAQPGAAAPTCKGKPATIVGTNGNDVRTGTPDKDVMVGLGGNDKLSGLAGNDLICGGSGKDTLNGGKGNDKLYGQSGRDTLKGGPGKDKLKGGPGKDKQVQ